ncbi:ATP-dependent helicase [Micromonospora sp. NBC_01796]|uniref:ATP-dependent helicase n=1 Tax=Micromonospora sp. NBC_01796 TaxID=2975987 RepID=UPI002DD86A42|nr:ATP-dependent helicase [Micromonospora sp. NBC_01796]WSA87422.1 ATP-dependent helicase [Micromonospora sp. NBC_01796]
MTLTGEYPAEKASLLDEPHGNLVLLAPPGCGKTEALALRAMGLIESKRVTAPNKLLALAFSNRARDNIGGRIRQLTQPAIYRQLVDLTNFHGLAARIYQAHASTIGLDPEAIMPERGWLRQVLTTLSDHHPTRQAAMDTLTRVKLQPLSDEEIASELERSGNDLAITAERIRHDSRRLDYSDLLRHAQRILLNEGVAELYALHYSAIIVDEFQDLSPQQLSIVSSISRNNVTYAGDLGQAIYSFTGADPEAVLATLRRLPDVRIIEFTESYRSSPAVLDVLNAVGKPLGLLEVRSAEPATWKLGGFSGAAAYVTPEAEAHFVINSAKLILDHNPNASVGAISRAGYRRKALDQLLKEFSATHPVFVWDSPVHRPDILRILRKEMARIRPFGGSQQEQLEQLKQASIAAFEPSDVESIDDVQEACAFLADRVQEGSSVVTALDAIGASGNPERTVGPGLHVLNAHIGKGQQFDWVFVIGLEEGHVPMFLAKTDDEITEEHRALVVMVSRARHGIVGTRALETSTRYGPRASSASRWWDAFENASRNLGPALHLSLDAHLNSQING